MQRLIFFVITIVILGSCQKEIDFVPSSSSSGLLHSDGEILGKWKYVNTSGYSNLTSITSDGTYLYFDAEFSGSRRLCQMDSAGSITEIFDYGTGYEISTLEFIPPYVYSAQSSTNTGSIRVFDASGLQNSYDFDLGSSGRINKIYDLDTALLLGGSWQESSNFSAPSERNIGLINKQTGQYSEMGTSGPVYDIIEFEGELLKGSYYSSSLGRNLTRWDGTTWQTLGGPNTFWYNSQYRPISIQGLMILNGTLYFTGQWSTSSVAGRVWIGNTLADTDFYPMYTFNRPQFSTVTGNTIKTKQFGDEVYMFGDVVYTRLPEFQGCFHYQDGVWKAYRQFSQNIVVADIAPFQGYLYAVSESGYLYKHLNH